MRFFCILCLLFKVIGKKMPIRLERSIYMFEKLGQQVHCILAMLAMSLCQLTSTSV